ncbi:hypothetical protein EAF00_008018 [Botryotinia globosa]|nr:hypothetical protein EAF00_008018 [Botryotinia globosa]
MNPSACILLTLKCTQKTFEENVDDTLLFFRKVQKPGQPYGRSNEPPKLDDLYPSFTPIKPIVPFDDRFLQVSFHLIGIKHRSPKLPSLPCSAFPDKLPGRSLLVHQKMIAILITKLYIQYLQPHHFALKMNSELNSVLGTSKNARFRIEASQGTVES